MSKANFNLSNPDYFYKYLSIDRSDFFKHCSFRFSQKDSLNDPFEQSMADRTDIENLSEGDRKAFYATIGNIYSHSSSLLSTLIKSKMAKEQEIANRKIQNQISAQGGILCLSEIPDNILMWSHYASEHQGIAIEIESSHFFHNQLPDEKDGFIVHRTRYRDSRIEDQPIGLFEYLFRIPHDTVATKSNHWSYEQEWRIEKILNTTEFSLLKNLDGTTKFDPKGHAIFLYQIPKKFITKVIFGANCSLERIREISQTISTDPELGHVSMKIAAIDPSDFKLRFLNIKAEDLAAL